ncbi:MAG: hypothetical protein Q7S52_04880 [bacterium]|nr:hypothetical protein [bacterium]
MYHSRRVLFLVIILGLCTVAYMGVSLYILRGHHIRNEALRAEIRSGEQTENNQPEFQPSGDLQEEEPIVQVDSSSGTPESVPPDTLPSNGGSSSGIGESSSPAPDSQIPVFKLDPLPSPTPIVTPPPPPPPQTPPTPSEKFKYGNRVQVIGTASLNVRATANGTLRGTQITGALGTVTGGPTNVNGYNWWNINYDTGADGWSVENYLAKTTISAQTPTPPPTPPLTFTLSVSKSGTGNGIVFGEGIACGTFCSESVNSGVSVSLTAAPVSDSIFFGWSGACTGTGVCVVSMTESRSVMAVFDVSEPTPAPTPTPPPTLTSTITVVMIGTGSGIVSGGPIWCESTCNVSVPVTDSVTLIATPSPGSVFTGWGKSCAGTDLCSFVASENIEITAQFDITP